MVLMHEAQHADTFKSGKQADRTKLGRAEYIKQSIADEAEAVVRQLEGLAVTTSLGGDMTGAGVDDTRKQRYMKAFYAKRDELTKADPEMDTGQDQCHLSNHDPRWRGHQLVLRRDVRDLHRPEQLRGVLWQAMGRSEQDAGQVTTQGPDLTAVAIAVGEPLGGQVLDGQAQLAPVAVAGIKGTVVWRVRDESGPHPWQVYVGAWPDGSMRVLTGDQDAWADLVAATGAHLASAAQARSYVETYLEVTRGAMVIVRPVTSLDELRWRPGTADEEAAKAALLADPPPIAPVLDSSADGFHIELTLVVDQRLQRNVFDLTSAGEMTRTSFSVLAERLPLPIAR